MPHYKLLRIDAHGEHEIEAFTASDDAEACKRHLEAWKNKTTSHAVVLSFEGGERHSFNDSTRTVIRIRAKMST